MGLDENEKVLGRFKATGIRPRFSERLKAFGIDLGQLLFMNAEQQGKPAPWERR